MRNFKNEGGYAPTPQQIEQEEELKKINAYMSKIDSQILKSLAKEPFNPSELDKLLKIREQLKKAKFASNS